MFNVFDRTMKMNEKHLDELMGLFLVDLRQKAGLSQQDVAVRSDVINGSPVLDQRSVSRMEKSPLSASSLSIAAYMNAVGRTPVDFYEKLKLETQVMKDETHSASPEALNINAITTKITKSLNKVETAVSIFSKHNESLLNDLKIGEHLDAAIDTLKGLERKPVIGVFGHFDVGKSTILNTLLGTELLPERYQPATSIVNLIVHETDRPSSLGNYNVAVFRKGFLPHMIHSVELVDKYLVEKGDYSLLPELGMHDYDEQVSNDAYIAMIFFKSDILKNVWLLDTPGQLNDEETGDTEKALSGVELVDGVMYVSPVTGFLDAKDIPFFSQILRNRPPVSKDKPLSHLLMVASHAHSSITEEQLSFIRYTSYKRLKKSMNELIFDIWKEDDFIEITPDPRQLTERTYPFWRENKEYKQELSNQFSLMALHLTANHDALVDQAIKRLEDSLLKIIERCKGELESKKQDVQIRVEALDAQEKKFRVESAQVSLQINELIDSCSQRADDDKDKVLDYYNANMNPDSLSKMIRSNFDDKKDASTNIGAIISQKLSTKVERTLKQSGRFFNVELDQLLERWQKAFPSNNSFSKEHYQSEIIDEFDVSGFNTRAAFIGGMSGLTSLGAMSLYVSSTISSNLGAYILVAKVGGWLTTLGITSSVTTSTSFVAAIGGPIVVGAIIAGVIGYAVYRLVGNDWQTSLAKKVYEKLQSTDTESKLIEPIDKYWDGTQEAVRAGLAALIKESEEQLTSLRKDAETIYDVQEINRCLDVCCSIMHVLKNQ